MLTERQLEIVFAVVYEYIKTGEPVGSRTISRKFLKSHSAATIRNEMSDLEEMGYFTQPHSSAGRLPTSQAYRVYVNSILHRPTVPPREKFVVISAAALKASIRSFCVISPWFRSAFSSTVIYSASLGTCSIAMFSASTLPGLPPFVAFSPVAQSK